MFHHVFHNFIYRFCVLQNTTDMTTPYTYVPYKGESSNIHRPLHFQHVRSIFQNCANLMHVPSGIYLNIRTRSSLWCRFEHLNCIKSHHSNVVKIIWIFQMEKDETLCVGVVWKSWKVMWISKFIDFHDQLLPRSICLMVSYR